MGTEKTMVEYAVVIEPIEVHTEVMREHGGAVAPPSVQVAVVQVAS